MKDEFYQVTIPGQDQDDNKVDKEITYEFKMPEGCKPHNGHHPYGKVVDLAARARVRAGGRLY